MKITLIGDIHGKVNAYLNIARQFEYSLQVGDFGFYRDYLNLEKSGLNAEKHKFIGGNHDNYDVIETIPNYLKDYGVWNEIFYIRGATSIDAQYRTAGVDWWSQENMPDSQFDAALTLYRDAKPQIVVSHTCPQSVALAMFGPLNYNYWRISPNWYCKTQVRLEEFINVHMPHRWYFGHFHQTKKQTINNTLFTCLAELDYEEVEV